MSGIRDITIRHELQPGDLGRVITLHGECYESLPGFGLTFEAFVARTIAADVLDAGANGSFWLAERNGLLVGCAAIVLRDSARGQLRWVLVDPTARGVGLGTDRVGRALAGCRNHDCTTVFLETTDGLPESESLYRTLGFRTVSETPEKLWDEVRPLIVMELTL